MNLKQKYKIKYMYFDTILMQLIYKCAFYIPNAYPALPYCSPPP